MQSSELSGQDFLNLPSFWSELFPDAGVQPKWWVEVKESLQKEERLATQSRLRRGILHGDLTPPDTRTTPFSSVRCELNNLLLKKTRCPQSHSSNLLVLFEMANTHLAKGICGNNLIRLKKKEEEE